MAALSFDTEIVHQVHYWHQQASKENLDNWNICFSLFPEIADG